MITQSRIDDPRELFLPILFCIFFLLYISDLVRMISLENSMEKIPYTYTPKQFHAKITQ